MVRLILIYALKVVITSIKHQQILLRLIKFNKQSDS